MVWLPDGEKKLKNSTTPAFWSARIQIILDTCSSELPLPLVLLVLQNDDVRWNEPYEKTEACSSAWTGSASSPWPIISRFTTMLFVCSSCLTHSTASTTSSSTHDSKQTWDHLQQHRQVDSSPARLPVVALATINRNERVQRPRTN